MVLIAMHYGIFTLRVSPAYSSSAEDGFTFHGTELLDFFYISLHLSFFEITFSRDYKRLLYAGLTLKTYICPATSSPPTRLFH